MSDLLIDTPEKMGWELVGQSINIRVEEKIENTFATFTLNFMGIAYSCQVPKSEMSEPKNWRDAWGQLLHECALKHAMGNQKLYKDGSRDLTEEEQSYMEKKGS